MAAASSAALLHSYCGGQIKREYRPLLLLSIKVPLSVGIAVVDVFDLSVVEFNMVVVVGPVLLLSVKVPVSVGIGVVDVFDLSVVEFNMLVGVVVVDVGDVMFVEVVEVITSPELTTLYTFVV